MDNSEQSENQATSETNWKYNPAVSGQDYGGGDVSDGVGVPLQPIPSVEWTASEYIAHEKSAGWYSALFAGSFLLVVFIYVVTRDILVSIVILLSCVAIGVYAGRKPATKKIHVKRKRYSSRRKISPLQ